MASFPSFTPTYSSFRKRSNPIVRNVRFADGYEHRVLFGLAAHQSPKTFDVEFNESEEDADVIEAFLESRENDQASFDFTPPGETSSSKFVCENWSKQIPYVNRATIQATFREVFQV